MKKHNKAQIGVEEVIVWIIVIAVLIMGATFLWGSDLDLILKNTPNLGGISEEDRVIDMTDLETYFDCKYPIGRIPLVKSSRRTIELLNIKEIELTEPDKIGERLKNSIKKEYLQLDINEKIHYHEKKAFYNIITDNEEEIGSLESELQTSFKRIVLTKEAIDFMLNDLDIKITGLDNPPKEEFRQDLKLLNNAVYHLGTGLLCGDEQIIRQLKEEDRCIENCEIYGGECKNSGTTDEIEIQGINCNIGKCFIKGDQNLEKDELKIKEFKIKFEYGWESILDKNKIYILNVVGGTPSIGISYIIEGDEFCSFFRTNIPPVTNKIIKDTHNFYLENWEYHQNTNKILMISAYPKGNPSENIHKNILLGIRYSSQGDPNDWIDYGTPSRD